MAARFWRSVLGGELVLALALAAVLAALSSLPALAALLLALVLALFAPGALVAFSFLVAALSSPARAAPARASWALRALGGEAFDFNRAMLAMALGGGPLPASVEGGEAAARPARPVLLVHGIVCNRSVWRGWIERLRAEGFAPVRAVNLEPLCADLGLHAARVERELRSLQRECDGAPVAIVAHSMGGLVARAALRASGPQLISRIVTLGSPHHGTRIAGWFGWPPMTQMTPGSPWLRALNAAQEGRLAVPLTSIYSLEDNLIVPAASARLEGAEMRELRGVGHLGLLSSPRALEHAVAALAGA
jgi:pimeloyl-ACP methyl ester carboxylesterase